jgi:predicted amidohydrolase YtcJ
VAGDDEQFSSIEPGKLADLVVIDGDYLTVPEDQIGEMPIALTMVDGRIVFEAE